MQAEPQQLDGVSVRVEDLLNLQKRLAGLSLNSFRKSSSLGQGARRARIRGRGMEYEESRAYVVGDDVKTFDWRVMARTGEAHTKVFAEEKERSFIIAIDLSASMFFGTEYSLKSFTAARLAAHLGWLASFSGDRVGGVVVSPARVYPVKPLRNRRGLLAMFHNLAAACEQNLPLAQAPGRLNRLLNELQRSVKPGATIVLISDFLGIDNNTGALLQSLVKHHELVAFGVYDKTESSPWLPGRYPVRSGEKTYIIDNEQRGGEDWLIDLQQNHRKRRDSLMSRFNIGLRHISCNNDLTTQLMPYLKS